MLACWEGPSAGLLHHNSLMLLYMTVTELDVFSENMSTCTSQMYIESKIYKVLCWKKTPGNMRQGMCQG